MRYCKYPFFSLAFAAAFFLFTSTATAEQDEPSDADAVAKELANPAGSLASLKNNFEYREYKGQLPGSNSIESWTYSFQPVLPWEVGNEGNRIIFRPLIPVPIDPPYFNTNKGKMDNGDIELGDTTFDLVYAGTNKEAGYLWGLGAAGTFPTATDDGVGGDQWRFGPELFGGILREWGIVGALVSNQLKLGGASEDDHSAMAAQYFYAYGLGGGWQITASPIITADWEANSDNTWSVPIGFGIAKTTVVGKLPLKIQFEVDKYVVQPDDFGQDWLVKLTLTPVIDNPFRW